MLILQDMTGNIIIQNESGKVTLSQAESWELLEYLHDTVGRDELYRAAYNIPCEPQPNWKTCKCSTCTYVRSVLKDGEQEDHS